MALCKPVVWDACVDAHRFRRPEWEHLEWGVLAIRRTFDGRLIEVIAEKGFTIDKQEKPCFAPADGESGKVRNHIGTQNERTCVGDALGAFARELSR
jgi:hypothetical protein